MSPRDTAGAIFQKGAVKVVLVIAALGGFGYFTIRAAFSADAALNRRIEERIHASPVAAGVWWLVCRADPPPDGCGPRPKPTEPPR